MNCCVWPMRKLGPMGETLAETVGLPPLPPVVFVEVPVAQPASETSRSGSSARYERLRGRIVVPKRARNRGWRAGKFWARKAPRAIALKYRFRRKGDGTFPRLVLPTGL